MCIIPLTSSSLSVITHAMKLKNNRFYPDRISELRKASKARDIMFRTWKITTREGVTIVSRVVYLAFNNFKKIVLIFQIIYSQTSMEQISIIKCILTE